jgi:small subunit ribosomal protein S5
LVKSNFLNERFKSDLKELLVAVNRVSKTVKGGRIFKFTALMVVGDGKGTVGIGSGKSSEIPDAIRKGIADAKKNTLKITLYRGTSPHEVVGKYGAGKVLMKPASSGTGVLAGGPVRAVIEAVGIKDLRAKSLRSDNPHNVVKAVMQGLGSLRDAKQVARVRNKAVREILS